MQNSKLYKCVDKFLGDSSEFPNSPFDRSQDSPISFLFCSNEQWLCAWHGQLGFGHSVLRDWLLGVKDDTVWSRWQVWSISRANRLRFSQDDVCIRYCLLLHSELSTIVLSTSLPPGIGASSKFRSSIATSRLLQPPTCGALAGFAPRHHLLQS